MKNCVCYLNSGKSCLPRLLVSISSLREFYSGELNLVQFGEDGLDIILKMQDKFKINIILPNIEIAERKQHFLEKTRIHNHVDCENCLFIDSDTLIKCNFDELFSEIESNEFIAPQFADWSMRKRILIKRTRPWQKYDQNLYNKFLKSNLPSINVGVFGFNRNSELMKNWYDFTILNKGSFIPDESACHLLVHKYKSKIVSNIYNYSCSKDMSPIENAKIIHYHGKKHCRYENGNLKYHGELWVDYFNKLIDKNECDVSYWFNECGDKRLKGISI